MTDNSKAHIFVCTNKTESECLKRMLFGTSKLYADDVLSVKSGDLLFLLNVNSNILRGISAQNRMADKTLPLTLGKASIHTKLKLNLWGVRGKRARK